MNFAPRRAPRRLPGGSPGAPSSTPFSTPSRGTLFYPFSTNLNLNNIANGCYQTHIECILSVQYSKRLLPVKFNVLKGSVNLLFVMIVFFSRSANAQILYLFFPPQTFAFSGEQKNGKTPKCRKADIGSGDGGFSKEGFF